MTTSTDEGSFETQVRRHARELQVHCYRMTGSLEEAEDLVQETFLRAWRKRAQFEGRSSLRAWLYRIATNACLDALDKRPRVPTADGEVLWLQPYPDSLLEGLSSEEDGPEAVVVARETLELAFLVAIQHLAPLPRAVLVLRDVLDLSARETAEVLETTVASVNSALQRARAGLREHLPAPLTRAPTTVERELLARYVEASERMDIQALAALLHEDARWTMPPHPGVWQGCDTVVRAWVDSGFGAESFGSLRSVATRANGQPAAASYVRTPGAGAYRPLTLDVLRIEDARIREITTFDGRLLERFGVGAKR